MLGRLLERLQHRVEGALREHVHLVDEIHLVAARRRGVARVLDDLPHVIDAGVRSGVEFDEIRKSPGVDLRAGGACAAGGRRDTRFAVERFRKDARDRGLADSPGAGEQVRLMQSARLECVRERAHDVFLAEQFGEVPRAVLAGEGERGAHGSRGGRRDREARRKIEMVSRSPGTASIAMAACFRT